MVEELPIHPVPVVYSSKIHFDKKKGKQLRSFLQDSWHEAHACMVCMAAHGMYTGLYAFSALGGPWLVSQSYYCPIMTFPLV